MKKVLSNNIAAGVRQPYTQVTHEWYNAMITEAVEALGKGLLGTNSNFIVLYGCVNSDAPDADISAGAIFYNGEIYLCPAFVDATISNDIVGTITTAYDALDPILFSDGNSYNVHEVKTIVWSDAASGSGDIDYADLYSQISSVKKVIAIGDWDMDTTASVAITHGIVDITKISSISATIINDTSSGAFPINLYDSSTGVTQGGITQVSSVSVTLSRLTGGNFDSATFNSTSFNRGFITIEVAL